MFTAGNPRLSPQQKCPEPLPDLHHVQREVHYELCHLYLFSSTVYIHRYIFCKALRTNNVSIRHYKLSCLIFPRLLIYGKYCSHVETAIATLDNICKDREDVRMKLEVKRFSVSVNDYLEPQNGQRMPSSVDQRHCRWWHWADSISDAC